MNEHAPPLYDEVKLDAAVGTPDWPIGGAAAGAGSSAIRVLAGVLGRTDVVEDGSTTIWMMVTGPR